MSWIAAPAPTYRCLACKEILREDRWHTCLPQGQDREELRAQLEARYSGGPLLSSAWAWLRG